MEFSFNRMLDRLQRHWTSEPLIAAGLLIAAVAFNLIYLYSSFSVQISPGSDILLHTLLSEAVSEAVSSGKNFTDPWLGSMGMGHPMFHYYQHLPHLGVGLVHVITFKAFAVADIVRWSTYLLISIFPLSIYWSLRRFGFDQLSSALGGLVASLIATNGISGFSYTSYIGSAQGLYTQLWAMVLMPLALASGYRVLREGKGYFWAVLLLAATFTSHVLYGYMTFITLGVLAFVVPMRFRLPWDLSSLSAARSGSRAQRRRSRRSGQSQTPSIAVPTPPESETPPFMVNLLVRFRRLALISLLVVAVVSYFLVPLFLDIRFFNSSDVIDPRNYDSHGHSAVLRGLFEGDLFDFNRFPSLTILLFAGLVVCLFKWRNPVFLVPPVVFVLWLLLYFGRPTWGPLIDLLPFSQNILMFRFIGGVHLGGILLIAVALGVSWRWAISRPNVWYSVAALAVTVLFLAPVYIDRRDSLGEKAQRLDRCQQQETAEDPDLNALFDVLDRLPPGRVYAGRFIYYEQHWGSSYFGACTLLQSRALAQGLDTTTALFHRYSLTSDVLDNFDESRPEQYNLFNIRYVIAPEGQSFPGFVRPLRQFGPHRLYEVETTGYFDLVGSEIAFAGEKDDFLPAATSWLASGLPGAKQHPVVFMGDTSAEIPTSLSEAPQAISAAAAGPLGPSRGMVFSEEIGKNHFAADVSVERESILLLKASYHPNWRAEVGGAETETLMVMPGFVGIELPPGEDSVRLDYQPRRLRTVLFILGLLTLPLIAVVEARGRFFSERLQLQGRFNALFKRG